MRWDQVHKIIAHFEVDGYLELLHDCLIDNLQPQMLHEFQNTSC
jgi:hypothetical protein